MTCGRKIGPYDCCSVVCGDCLELMKAIPDGCVDAVITDPPYGVAYTGGKNPVSNVERESLRGDLDGAAYASSLPEIARILQTKSSLYLWFADRNGRAVYDAVEDAGLQIRALIVWNKINPHYGAIFARYKQRHEPCLYAVKETGFWDGPSNETTVWDIPQPTTNEFHPTQKPVQCMERAIRNSVPCDGTILDPFAGSGTTGVAAKKLGRHYLLFEISEEYCRIARDRIARAEAQPSLFATPAIQESLAL